MAANFVVGQQADQTRLGGVQMVMLGLLGEYLWRALDESRGRPRYIVERRTDRS